MRRAAKLILAVLVLGPGVSAAQAEGGHSTGDAAATRHYLHALHQQTLATQSLHAAERAATMALPTQVKAQCPDALAGAPETSAPNELGGSATNHLANEVAIEAAHMYKELANAELPLPDICTDASAYAKSAFQSVPVSTTRLLRENSIANSKIALAVRRPEYPAGQTTTKIP